MYSMENKESKQQQEEKQDVFVSSHNGKIIKNGGSGIRNSYEIWRDKNNKLYVKMTVLKKGEELKTLFDHDDLEKIIKTKGTWSVTKEFYVMSSTTKQYLHHIIMGYENSSEKIQGLSTDHINRERLDNRKANLRFADSKTQNNNTKCIVDGVKKEKSNTSTPLPEGITQDMIPVYAYYHPKDDKEMKEYFIIRGHNIQDKNICVNGKEISNSIKSSQASWKNKNSKNKIPYPIIDKLNEIKRQAKKLDEIYQIYLQNPNNKNISMTEDSVLKEILEDKVPDNKKIVYEYDLEGNFLREHESLVATAKFHECSENTISRYIREARNNDEDKQKKFKKKRTSIFKFKHEVEEVEVEE